MSLVSVITPAYNASCFLADTIRSVQSQTFTDWEMIIVDDYSKDDTYSIALAFAQKDSRIKVIRHQENGGVAVARNTALDVAIGEYIAFLDSDDLWMPDKLEKQIRFMEENRLILTYTNYHIFNSDTGKIIRLIRSPKRMTYQSIFRNTGIGCLTVMVNKNLSGNFHMPLLRHTEDNCTWQAILKPGYTAYLLDETLSLYRSSDNSLTKNKKQSAKYQWEYYRKYYGFSIYKSSFYFCCYAFNAIKKHFL